MGQLKLCFASFICMQTKVSQHIQCWLWLLRKFYYSILCEIMIKFIWIDIADKYIKNMLRIQARPISFALKQNEKCPLWWPMWKQYTSKNFGRLFGIMVYCVGEMHSPKKVKIASNGHSKSGFVYSFFLLFLANRNQIRSKRWYWHRTLTVQMMLTHCKQSHSTRNNANQSVGMRNQRFEFDLNCFTVYCLLFGKRAN